MAKSFVSSIGGFVKRAAGSVKAAFTGRSASKTPTPSPKPASKGTSKTQPVGAASSKPKTVITVPRKSSPSKTRQALSKQPVITGRRKGPWNKKSTKNLSKKQRATVEKDRKKDRDDKKTRRQDASKAASAQRKNTSGAEPKAKQSVSSRIVGKIAGAIRSVGKGRRARRGS